MLWRLLRLWLLRRILLRVGNDDLRLGLRLRLLSFAWLTLLLLLLYLLLALQFLEQLLWGLHLGLIRILLILLAIRLLRSAVLRSIIVHIVLRILIHTLPTALIAWILHLHALLRVGLIGIGLTRVGLTGIRLVRVWLPRLHRHSGLSGRLNRTGLRTILAWRQDHLGQRIGIAGAAQHDIVEVGAV